MAAPFDDSDFVDTDFQAARKDTATGTAVGPALRPPSREELDARVHDTQQRLEDLRRVQEQLEQERAALEEARRRRTEYHTGREEMLQNLARGLGLLEEAEFAARRDAEQMTKTLADLRDHLARVQALNDQVWTQENYTVELTAALTTLENARMEWNAAQVKWPVLAGDRPTASAPASPKESASPWTGLGFLALCRLGLALTWPVAVAALLAALVFAFALYRQ